MTRLPDDQNQPDSARGVTRDLASRIASAKRERDLEDKRASNDASADTSGMARGLRIGSEFVAAILVGSGIGYLIDLGLGTSPWAMLIMFMVGFAAGIRNVISVVTEMNAATPAPPASATEADAEDAKRTEK